MCDPDRSYSSWARPRFVSNLATIHEILFGSIAQMIIDRGKSGTESLRKGDLLQLASKDF